MNSILMELCPLSFQSWVAGRCHYVCIGAVGAASKLEGVECDGEAGVGVLHHKPVLMMICEFCVAVIFQTGTKMVVELKNVGMTAWISEFLKMSLEGMCHPSSADLMA